MLTSLVRCNLVHGSLLVSSTRDLWSGQWSNPGFCAFPTGIFIAESWSGQLWRTLWWLREEVWMAQVGNAILDDLIDDAILVPQTSLRAFPWWKPTTWPLLVGSGNNGDIHHFISLVEHGRRIRKKKIWHLLVRSHYIGVCASRFLKALLGEWRWLSRGIRTELYYFDWPTLLDSFIYVLWHIVSRNHLFFWLVHVPHL